MKYNVNFWFLICLGGVISCNSGAKHLTEGVYGSRASENELKEVFFIDSILKCCVQSGVSMYESLNDQYVYIAFNPDSLFIAKLDTNYSNPAIKCYLYTENHYYTSGIDRELIKDTSDVDFSQIRKSFNKVHADLPCYHVLDYGIEYSFPHKNVETRVTFYYFATVDLPEDVENKYALVLPLVK